MELDSIKADKVLDTRGLSCPMPILKTKKELKNMNTGEILEILGTDPGSKNDFPAYASKAGDEFLGLMDVPEGFTRYFIRKGT
jgi:tRNA 2-thiouridine synthesizing protein A